MIIVKNFISIFTIVLLGLAIRLVGINWDQGTFLHPDERFLVMVVQGLSMPDSMTEYLSPKSPLQVRNTEHSFYVYGSFPVVFVKTLSSLFLEEESFKTITSLGRTVSIVLETGIIFLVFILARFFTKKYKLPNNVPLWSSFLYSFSVLPIQLSHFFTVDPFITFFSLLSLVLISKIEGKLKTIWTILSGISWGIAISSKATAVFWSPLLALFIIYLIIDQEKNIIKITKKILFLGLIFSISSYLSIRFFNPEYFSNPSWINPTISPEFLRSLETLKSWSNENTWFPPATQWMQRTPILFSLKNIFFFGLGMWQSILVVLGIIWVATKKTKSLLLISVLWMIAFTFWQGSQFVQSLRYFYFIYPFFALFGALSISKLQQNKIFKKHSYVFTVFIISLVMIWPLMFLQIFLNDHSRVQATHWIREEVPQGSNLIYEYWDDALPLSYAPGKNISYPTKHISIFERDSEKKWQEINDKLSSADYYIVSSNRAWASIMRLPERYPTSSEFYNDLFLNKTNFSLVKSFESEPSLKWMGINLSLNDQWAEEAFTVYDHPSVYIFRKK
jgi:hypothetical protein